MRAVAIGVVFFVGCGHNEEPRADASAAEETARAPVSSATAAAEASSTAGVVASAAPSGSAWPSFGAEPPPCLISPEVSANVAEPDPPGELSMLSDKGPHGRTLKLLAPAFRRCFQRALQDDPNMEGKVKLHVKLGPKGEVTNVTPSHRVGLPKEMVECCARAAAAKTFDPPEAGKATLVIPLSFVRQK
jgi:hypothetical protein